MLVRRVALLALILVAYGAVLDAPRALGADAKPAQVGGFAFTDGISAAGYPGVGYDQPNRPQFHFCSKKNWLNDPNGMVWDGEFYHLFFQHNPKATRWGNMTWGHAVSRDMIRWTQRDHALLPYQVDGRRGTIYSGTAVVDHNNSLGKQVGDTKTLCAFYTFASKPKFYQAMAYSTDGGETWTYWDEGRAVVPNQGFDNRERDPKVFWHEASGQWVMALWVQRKPGRVRFFTSQNLTDWRFASDLMRDWAFECMDVVFLPVDGDPANTKCVIYDASFDYEVGAFDGKVFRSETPALKHARSDFYAAQTFNQGPGGRVVQIGWMRGPRKLGGEIGVPHNQQMSFPCDLTLKSTPYGLRLFCYPIPEVASLVKTTHTLAGVTLTRDANALADLPELDLVDLDVTFRPGGAAEVVFDLPRVTLRYLTKEQKLVHTGLGDKGRQRELTCLGNLAPRDGLVTLRLLIDRLSLEAYAFGGEAFSAHYIHPRQPAEQPCLRAIGGQAELVELTVRELGAAWPKP
ncbi:MAG: glycoside hydrolase family 32 protein [Planctomycetota bacterium]